MKLPSEYNRWNIGCWRNNEKYYITAFAVDSNNVVIWTQQTTITTSFWWHPSANTVAYFPFDTNFNDSLWNYNLTTKAWSPTITTLNWLKCLYLNWSSSVWNDSFHSNALWMNFTVCAFVRIAQTEIPRFTNVYWNSWYSYRKWFYISAYIWQAHWLQWQYWNNQSSWDILKDTSPLSQNTWTFVCITCANWLMRYYKNAVQTISQQIAFQQNNNWVMRVWSSNYNQWSWEQYFWNWYVSRLICEKKTWSESDIVKYFNKLKSQYWY